MKQKAKRLFERWKLVNYFDTKSICINFDKDRMKELRKKSLEGTLTSEDLSFEDISHGETAPDKILSLLPDSLIDYFLSSDFRLNYNNGSCSSSYDPQENRAEIKATDDMLHEIGHCLWYEMIPGQESSKIKAVIESLSEDKSLRRKIKKDQIPTMHRVFGILNGAYSGQFLRPQHDNIRINDLEEHFARSFDYLVKGKPIITLDTSNANIDDFLSFYRAYSIIDDDFIGYYKRSIRDHYEGQGLIKRDIRKIPDGDRITKDDLARISQTKDVDLRGYWKDESA